jgi:PAS domain S-box-containing protein
MPAMSDLKLQAKSNAKPSRLPNICTNSRRDTFSQMTTTGDLGHVVDEAPVGSGRQITERQSAEEELQKSQAYLSEAQRLSHTGSFGWKPETGEIIWSDETFRIFEFEPTSKVTVERIDQRTHPDDRLAAQELIERATRERTELDLEHRLLMPNGCVKYVHVAGRPSIDKGGRFEFVGAVTDITERKQAEQRLIVQYTVSQVLAESDTLQEVTPKILHAVCEYLTWDLGQLWRTDRATGVLRCVEAWHKESIEATQFVASSRDRTLLPGIGLPGRVWSSLEPAYIPDVVEDPNFPRSSIAILAGLHAAFAFPIVLGSEVLGVMEFFSREIRQPDQDLLNMMATVGSQIGQFIERKRAEEELRASESKYRHLVDTTPAFIHTSLPNGELDFCSRGMLEYVGLCLTDVLGWGWASLIHPEDAEVIAKWRAALEAGEPFVGELRVRRADGKYRWFFHREEPLRNEAGEIVKWYGSCFEIEERKIAEETIRAQETELRQILDLTPQHVGVFGANGRPLYVNQVGLEYFGIDMDQWRDQASRLDLVHPDDREQFIEAHNTAVLRGKPHEFESRLLRHDGRFRWFLFRLNPFKDEEGQVRRWYGTGTDIEDRKQAEEEIRKENIALREEIIKASMFEEIVGNSPPLQQVLSRVVKVAPTDATVLITGETGTGKELIARAIHKSSKRSARAFVSVNCAAIPQSLIPSELFGHEKGAFTGATGRRLGRFELAEGGTIFLDEVGELPQETQVALLRVLQEQEFERVGGSRSIKANVRVIVATNRDLEAAIAEGTFRNDLFYRLSVFPIEIPPLRQRREDIPMLVQYFIDRYARELGKNIRTVSKETLDLFQSSTWPGNIRELRNVIERSIIVCDTESFSVDESWLSRQPLPAQRTGKHELRQRLADQEREAIEAALTESRGRVFGPAGAAARLGIARSTLESKIRTLNIDKNRFKISNPS